MKFMNRRFLPLWRRRSLGPAHAVAAVIDRLLLLHVIFDSVGFLVAAAAVVGNNERINHAKINGPGRKATYLSHRYRVTCG
jgi:hypothetical protein